MNKKLDAQAIKYAREILKQEQKEFENEIQVQVKKLADSYNQLKESVLQDFVTRLGLEHCLEHLRIVTFPQDRIDGIERLMYRGAEVGQFSVRHSGLTFTCVFTPISKKE